MHRLTPWHVDKNRTCLSKARQMPQSTRKDSFERVVLNSESICEKIRSPYERSNTKTYLDSWYRTILSE
jgi:hypothetical protein